MFCWCLTRRSRQLRRHYGMCCEWSPSREAPPLSLRSCLANTDLSTARKLAFWCAVATPPRLISAVPQKRRAEFKLAHLSSQIPGNPPKHFPPLFFPLKITGEAELCQGPGKGEAHAPT